MKVRASVALLAAASLLAQAPTSQESVIRITVSLVQVDAVVTDSKGRPVTDLKASDFEILQDGKPQKITSFHFVSTVRPAPRPAPVKPVNRNAPAAPPPPPARFDPKKIHRTIALVVDDLGLSWESMAFVRNAIKKFIEEKLEPGDLAAIIRTGAGMGSLQGFTTDRRQLLAAADRVKWNPLGRGGVSAFAPLEAASDEATPDDLAAAARVDDFQREIYSVGTLGAVDYIVRGLKDLPGRKSVVILSDGVKIFNNEGNTDRVLESMRRLTDAANRASVVIYTIDARGLQTLGLTAADNTRGRSQQQIIQVREQRRDEMYDSQDGLNYLAAETGGTFQHSNNDITGALGKVLADQEGYYLLGYNPKDETFNKQFHKIKVRLKTPGLTVRSRNGFFGVPDASPRPVMRGGRHEQLATALASPFGSGGVKLRLTALFGNNSKTGSVVSSLLHIEGKNLTFSDEPEGWHKSVIDVLMVTFGDNGAPIDETNKTYTIRLKDDAYKSAMANGFVYMVPHPVKKPGAYQLRTAVRDVASERVGSASQFIEVPDVNKGRLALSGIFVKAKTSTHTAPPAGETESKAEEALGSPGFRIFQPGEEMYYAYQILNAKVDSSSKMPQLEANVRMFRDGQQIFESKPVLLNPSQQQDLKRIAAGGQLRLGKTMKPGDYVLQVVVHDKLARQKDQTLTQWIDFEVAPPQSR